MYSQPLKDEHPNDEKAALFPSNAAMRLLERCGKTAALQFCCALLILGTGFCILSFYPVTFSVTDSSVVLQVTQDTQSTFRTFTGILSPNSVKELQ